MPKTSITFVFIDYQTVNMFDSIQLLTSGRNHIQIKNKSSIYIEIEKTPEDCKYYYIEKISLYNTRNNEKSHPFNVTIYIDESNIIYCFINENSNFSFEIIYYDPDQINIPNYLIIKDIKLNQFENFGVKSCRRFVLMNCDCNYLQALKTKESLEINRKYKAGSFLITIQREKLELKEKETIEKEKDKKKNMIIENLKNYGKETNLLDILDIIDKDKIFKLIEEKLELKRKEEEIMEIVKLFKIRREYYSEFSLEVKIASQEILKIQEKLFQLLLEFDKGNNLNIDYIREKIKLDSFLIDNKIDQYFYVIRNKAANKPQEKFTEEHLFLCINYLYLKILEIKEKNIFVIEAFLKQIKSFYEKIEKNKEINIHLKISLLFFYYENMIYKLDINPKKVAFDIKLFDDEYDIKASSNINIKTKNKNLEIEDDNDDILNFEDFKNEIEKNNKINKYQLNTKKKIKSQGLSSYKISNNTEPEILFIKDCNKKSAYYQAIEILKQIILNINEKSALFELLLLVSSGTGNNKLKKEITYKLSLLSEEKIKKILIEIIPKFILRESNITRYNGYYSSANKILLINEYSYFGFSMEEGKKNLIENDDIEGIYTIPLLLLFMHEIFGHAFHNNRQNLKIGREHSPTNFTFKINNKYINFYTQNNGESGKIVEFYISPYKEVIFYMKYSGDKFPELLNFKSWTCSSFKDLNEYITKKIIATEYKEKMEIINYQIPSFNIDVSDSDDEYKFEEQFIYKTDFFIKKEKELKGCFDF